MTTWLTSDIHVSHANIISYCNRPFSSVEEMNEALVNNWNSVVKLDDTIYCLGDFSLSFIAAEKYSVRLTGKKLLVPGNHDQCHSFHKKSRKPDDRAKWIQKYEDIGWEVLPEQTTLLLEGHGEINLCHHPYSNDDSSGLEVPRSEGSVLPSNTDPLHSPDLRSGQRSVAGPLAAGSSSVPSERHSSLRPADAGLND